jgi:DNA-directed RNA polymerase subunit E'/Rpb7
MASLATERDVRDDCDVFLQTVLTERVSIPPKYQNKHVNDSIAVLLQNKVEGRCTKFGYIRPKSVEVMDISEGVLDSTAMNGSFIYNVRFKASVCNPPVGAVFRCKVENVNTYGISAVNMSEYRVLEVIVPKDIGDGAVDIDKIQVGSIVVVRVERKKYELHQDTITVIATIVSHDEDAFISSPALDVVAEEGEGDSVAASLPDVDDDAAADYDDDDAADEGADDDPDDDDADDEALADEEDVDAEGDDEPTDDEA